jgi:tRNA A-37 threonylcarbamoyl transferase component Bud32
MTRNSDLEDRLSRWRELQQKGRNCSAEELCADRPELAPALARDICKLERMAKLLALDPAEYGGTDELPRVPFGADSYEILEELGAGGMGIVYKARERQSGRLVALKRIRRFSADALNRFKKEWRILQDIRHPNLVPLYDMVSDGEQWFFTMQLIQGRPFLDSFDSVCFHATTPRIPGFFTPLRAAFRQLAGGILALHEHGVLHRDIKPSNVLVTERDEVILLDFGLATVADLDARSTTGEGPKGTLLYMAPEQADSRPEKASDWYSFGVVLFQALTGKDPFTGTPYAMPWTRNHFDPPAPHTLIADLPEDLSNLCAELLRADPRARPLGPDVCRRLEPTNASAARALGPVPIFLGRERHLATLDAAFADVRNGQTVTVLLHGSSGVGKSVLVQHFLGRLRETGNEVVIVGGRCYERESVPFKALDGLVDSLSRFWSRLPLVEAMALLPDGIGPLVRVFPVLQSAEAVAVEIQRLAQRRSQDLPDPHELRRRAFAALREVLARIGRRWTLVLHLDDLQWGDVDSALMLAEILQPPEPPPLLLLTCFRGEDRNTSPFLRTFTQEQVREASGLDWRELPLGVLTFEEARDLAGHLLTRDGAAASKGVADLPALQSGVAGLPALQSGVADLPALQSGVADLPALQSGVADLPAATISEAVARESGGNPFFVWQLVQAVRAGDTDLTLDELIGRRVAALSDSQRRLLQVIAVAGRPLDPAVALLAAGVGDDGRNSLIDLQSADARLLRAGPTGQNGIETYHDRIRETVVAHLTTEARKNYHHRLAIAQESSRQADPEVLAVHYEGAEEWEKASLYAERAAERADAALAFERAAELYRRALGLWTASTERGGRLQHRLGDALANAGRSAEAAAAYLVAVAGASPGEALELQRRAAEQFLRAGHMEEGRNLVRLILQRVGLNYPETNRQALGQLLLRRLQLWWRGTKIRERAASALSPEELTRIDVCWSSGQVLSMVDIVRGWALSLQFCLLALRGGEPSRAALALALQATYQSFVGGSKRRRIAVLHRRANECAERIQDPKTLALICSHRGVSALLLGEFREAAAIVARAETLFRTECTGTAWELGACFHYRFIAMTWMGEWKRSALELPPLLREARERGDLFTTTCLLNLSARLQLTANEPEKARQAMDEAIKLWPIPWSTREFHLQHYQAMWAEAETALYSGEPDHAWHLIQERWPALQQSALLRVQYIRLTLLQLRARCALAAATHAAGGAQASAARGLLKSVESDVHSIKRERMPWSNAGARLLRAGMARVRGNRTETIGLLEEAETGFQAANMALHAASAQYCRGRLLGSASGRELIQAASETMTSQEIRSPERLLRIITPGLTDLTA